MQHILTSMSISTIHFYIYIIIITETQTKCLFVMTFQKKKKKNITQNTQEALTQTYTQIITTPSTIRKKIAKRMIIMSIMEIMISHHMKILWFHARKKTNEEEE